MHWQVLACYEIDYTFNKYNLSYRPKKAENKLGLVRTMIDNLD